MSEQRPGMSHSLSTLDGASAQKTQGEGSSFNGRVALQQRVLPSYRVPFFDTLAAACSGGLSVLSGQPCTGESITTGNLQIAHQVQVRNRHLFTPASPLYLCWQAGLIRWLETWQPEVLIVEANPRYRSTPAAVKWMRAHRHPVIGWGLGAPRLVGFLAGWRLKGRIRFLRSFDALIAYSQRGCNEYRELGFPTERVFIAPNAATPRPTSPAPTRIPSFTGRPNVLFVGRLQARKRIDHLLQACAALPEEIRPCLTIVGDGPARQELQTLAQTVYPQAKFPGERSGADLESYFASADLFVLPGTGGLAVQQAMAHGLPVIVAEGDGTQNDLVRPGNGWRVPAGDLKALTETIYSALSDAPRLRRLGTESYRIVAEEINLENMVSVFTEVIRAVNENW
jgi:glycosyltransferase involved in cell wall biosynthesis